VSYHVLLVTHSAATRSLVSATLEAEGAFEVIVATSAVEALAVLPRSSFDLIMTDINMPDINGLEVVRFIRESPLHRRVPVVIISTDSNAQDRDRAIQLGATTWIDEPFQPEQLLDTVQRLVQA
jgi:two-component system chemotaxis response regulator CheY